MTVPWLSSRSLQRVREYSSELQLVCLVVQAASISSMVGVLVVMLTWLGLVVNGLGLKCIFRNVDFKLGLQWTWCEMYISKCRFQTWFAMDLV